MSWLKKAWKEVKKAATPSNIAAIAASPFTAGASLALLKDTKGNTALDHITGAASAREQNEKNIQLQRDINQQQIDLQKETNQLQIDLANSAHRREIEDLTKAGINPILTAGGSGAATPQLGTAQLGTPQVQNELPGGYLAQAGQAASLISTFAGAKQLSAMANLNQQQALNTATDTQFMPAMKKAEIAANYANAGNARAQADYTRLMGQVDQEIKDAQSQEALARKNLYEAEEYRTRNLSKGEQSRLWAQAITGGLVNVAGTASGTLGAINTARSMTQTPLPIGFKY